MRKGVEKEMNTELIFDDLTKLAILIILFILAGVLAILFIFHLDYFLISQASGPGILYPVNKLLPYKNLIFGFDIAVILILIYKRYFE